MSTTIKLRRGTAATWASADSVLAQGEPALETDTGFLKLGDGQTEWTSLPYAVTAPVVESVVQAFGDATDGQTVFANGDGTYSPSSAVVLTSAPNTFTATQTFQQIVFNSALSKDGSGDPLIGIAASGARSGAFGGTVNYYGANAAAPNDMAWNTGIDTAAAVPWRDLFFSKVQSNGDVSDFWYLSFDNGNGAPAAGVGLVPPYSNAALSISGSDGDPTQGGVRIRQEAGKTAYPLWITTSSGGGLIAGFNATGAVMVGGSGGSLGGSSRGVQFLNTSGAVDTSLYLAASGVLTTTAALHLPGANGLQLGASSSFPLVVQQAWNSNDQVLIGHNLTYGGGSSEWTTTSASFGSRSMILDGSNGVAGGFFFYADDAATTAASVATTSLRFAIRNDGNVYVGSGTIATNATAGFFYIPYSAGAPAGTPTSLTGRVPMTYDATDHRFNIFDAQWRAIATTVARGTRTLVAGAASVANASITAASVIKAWNIGAGGTVGALSVTVTAGAGFAISSTSSTDTSKVYYEVVTY